MLEPAAAVPGAGGGAGDPPGRARPLGAAEQQFERGHGFHRRHAGFWPQLGLWRLFQLVRVYGRLDERGQHALDARIRQLRPLPLVVVRRLERLRRPDFSLKGTRPFIFSLSVATAALVAGK